MEQYSELNKVICEWHKKTAAPKNTEKCKGTLFHQNSGYPKNPATKMEIGHTSKVMEEK